MVTLIQQIVQPFVQHDIAGPALIQWPIIAAAKFTEQFVPVGIYPALYLYHTRIKIDFGQQIRVCDWLTTLPAITVVILIKQISEPQVAGIFCPLFNDQVKMAAIRRMRYFLPGTIRQVLHQLIELDVICLIHDHQPTETTRMDNTFWQYIAINKHIWNIP